MKWKKNKIYISLVGSVWAEIFWPKTKPTEINFGSPKLIKGRLVMPRAKEWMSRLLMEFHCTPAGGHSGAFHTYRRLAANVYATGNGVLGCVYCLSAE